MNSLRVVLAQTKDEQEIFEKKIEDTIFTGFVDKPELKKNKQHHF